MTSSALRQSLVTLFVAFAMPILTGAKAPDAPRQVEQKIRCIETCAATEEACFRSCGTCEDSCYGKTDFCARCQKKMADCRVPCEKARKDCNKSC